MGMFDYITCKVKLPDTDMSVTDFTETDLFQTKSLFNGLWHYTINTDLRFIDEQGKAVLGEDGFPFEGDIIFYTDVRVSTVYENVVRSEWYKYQGIFIEGKLIKLKRMPDKAYYCIEKPWPDENGKFKSSRMLSEEELQKDYPLLIQSES